MDHHPDPDHLLLRLRQWLWEWLRQRLRLWEQLWVRRQQLRLWLLSQYNRKRAPGLVPGAQAYGGRTYRAENNRAKGREGTVGPRFHVQPVMLETLKGCFNPCGLALRLDSDMDAGRSSGTGREGCRESAGVLLAPGGPKGQS